MERRSGMIDNSKIIEELEKIKVKIVDEESEEQIC